LVLLGSDGDDVLTGTTARDVLVGGSGADLLHGGDGDDFLYGGDGNDDLLGGNGNDELYGEAGTDILNGEDGNDELYGGNGRDILDGGAGADVLYGGAGADVLDGGDGVDRASYEDSPAGVKIDLGSSRSRDPWFAGDTFLGIEVIVGSNFNDVISIDVPSPSILTVYGMGGNDRITGSSANDFLDGGDGDRDAVNGGAGSDTCVAERVRNCES
jgi:Ca2+-binding RTX toxin-like protein